MHKLLPMRVLIINTSERIGGAAIAASRLMESLKNNGIKAYMAEEFPVRHDGAHDSLHWNTSPFQTTGKRKRRDM